MTTPTRTDGGNIARSNSTVDCRYRTRSVDVVAVRWFTNGDHPFDGVGETEDDPISGGTYVRGEGRVVRFYRHPDVAGTSPCTTCRVPMESHGFIDEAGPRQTVCPGDWVVTGVDGATTSVPHDLFMSLYEPVSP